MKIQWFLGGALALSILSCGGNTSKEERKEIALNTEIDSVSYALGVNISDGFTQQKIKGISTSEMTKGFNDFLAGTNYIKGADCMSYIQSFMIQHQMKLQDTVNNKDSYSKEKLDSLSYALGVNISESFKMQGVEGLNGNILAQGFNDLSNDVSKFKKEESLNILQSFMKKQQAKLEEKNKEKHKGIITEGEEFLANNAKKEGVVSLPSGLQYEIIKEGTGDKPNITNTVKAHYHGTLIDGTVFDSSVERGEPTDFPVSQVIKGWTEALQLMPVGSKWKLYIPYNLAYGERGSGDKIPPYSTLIFDVELLDIVNKDLP